MRRKLLPFILALALFALPLKQLSAEVLVWQVEEETSMLTFTFTQSGSTLTGQFHDFVAEIAFAPERLQESHLKVQVFLTSAETGSRDRDETLKGPDFFAVERTPEAIFEADRFTKLEDGRFIAHGSLTVKEQRHPLELPFHLSISEEDTGLLKAVAEGEVAVNRLAYGLGEGDWARDSFISHQVLVRFHIEATQSQE